MSHSQAATLLRGVSGVYMYDTKEDSGVASTDSGVASHGPRASYRRTLDVEGESDGQMTAHEAADVDSAVPNRTASSGEPILTDLGRTGPRVRFRSRVRISAGMGRRRRFSDDTSSDTSSLSGSPSSSISAPLRTHYTGKNGWGPLGSRLSMLSRTATQLRSGPDGYVDSGKGDTDGNGYENQRRQSMRSLQRFLDNDVDEYTHLMTSATTRSYVSNRYAHDWYHDEWERERWWKEQLMDEAFGKWPGRLLNRHWWWWHLEPILCSCCEDLDEEE